MMRNVLPFARTVPTDTASAEAMQHSPSQPPDEHSNGDEWAELMLRAQAGDRASYHALLQAVTPYLRSITRRYLGRGEDAEDALQEVLMVVHGIRHTYEPGRPFKPWLNTIASRRCIDLLRRRAHRLKHEIDAPDEIDSHPQVAHGPEETLARRQSAGTLHRAVAALPERQREAIRLLRLNELSLAEATAHCDQSIGSLKVAVHRALKSLQRSLGNKGRANG